MATENESSTLSPTLFQVIDRFVAAMRADDAVPNDAMDRLEKLLRKGTVPKPDDISTALFEPPPDDKS
jgi:hypothetical protein